MAVGGPEDWSDCASRDMISVVDGVISDWIAGLPP
jgi:hypothetical protein